MNGEKKLVEVFRAFFDKVVVPIVKTNDKVMADWRYLNSLISEEHIDYAKLDFYLVMLAPEKLSNKHLTMGLHHNPKELDSQKNNFNKKDFYDDQRNLLTDYSKFKSDANFLHSEPNSYRNSGLSPNKFIEPKETSKIADSRQMD